MEKLKKGIKAVLVAVSLFQAAIIMCGCYTVAGATAGAVYGAAKDTNTTFDIIAKSDAWFKQHAW